MIAKVVVDIRDQYVEGDAAIERLSVGLRLCAMPRERIDDFGIAATLAVL